ncbi:ABC transporter substrate-binding protein [Natronobeatus ordinarius]|uniref:ABC transporter substrate-binding protein n=1 Tax=Natronobeatus ordinarius TaxID=2963433 RepID=UPI0020CDF15B|nr:ABC transporter substrate-binding protein [Natronobeatus ordinarius]
MLGLIGAGATVGLAGCTGGDPSDDGGDDGGDDDGGFGDSDGGVDHDAEELPEVGGRFTNMHHATFTTLNPLYNTEAGAGSAIGYALDQGYTFDADQELFPLLYDLWTEDGGNVWVFEIRDGLEFSDPYGQVDAESFVYQIEELHQSDWANTASSSDWAGINVEQTGDLEFQAELEDAELLWPETYTPLEYPIPKDLVEPYVDEEDDDGLRQNEELIELQFTGNLGPYVLEEWERGAGTRYVRNDDYYLQEADGVPHLFSNAPYFEELRVDIVEEEATRVGALEAGEADTADIPPDRFAEFQENPDVDTYTIPQPYNNILSVNMRDNGWNAGPGNLFQIKEFRQALACAINKEEFIAGVYRGNAEPHFTWQPQFSNFYPGEDDIPMFGVGDLYGSEVARDLAQDAFDQSEYDYHFDGDDMVTPDGDQVVLDILYFPGSATGQLRAEYTAQELGDNLGIEVEPEAIGGDRFNNEYWTADPEGGEDPDAGLTWDEPSPWNPGPRSVTSNESWDMSVVFGLNTYPRNPQANDVFFDGATTMYNPVGYYPEFDAEGLFADARSAESQEEIQAIFEELFVNLAEEQPYIMLAFPDDLVGYTAGLRGPIENFSNGWDFPTWHY